MKRILTEYFILLKVIVTLSVTITPEITLKRIKNYLRNTTAEDILTGLALLSVYIGILIDVEEVINRFSKKIKTDI